MRPRPFPERGLPRGRLRLRSAAAPFFSIQHFRAIAAALLQFGAPQYAGWPSAAAAVARIAAASDCVECVQPLDTLGRGDAEIVTR